MVNGLDDFINANTKTSEIKHIAHVWDMLSFTDQKKKTGKIDWKLEVEIDLSKTATTKHYI